MKRAVREALLLGVFTAFSVQAAEKTLLVPALEKGSVAPQVESLEPSGASVTMSETENAALKLAQEWKDRPQSPTQGSDGRVTFIFGQGLPTMVCSPLYVCDLELAPGEVVQDINIGDAIRWKISPATVGRDQRAITHLIVKPTEVGIVTNIVITTDERAYCVKLVSSEAQWMPRVAFHYPEDSRKQWAAYALSMAEKERERERRTLPVTQQDAATLDFGFRLSGDFPNWRPVRIYTDGSKTYIQFPGTIRSDEMPALVALGPGRTEQLVNYRVVGDRYVVDKVLTSAALISGVGKEQRSVSIVRN